MDKLQVKERIFELGDEFYKGRKDSQEKQDLVKIYSANSIDSIEFLLCIEDEYDIEFDDDKLNVETLKDIDTLVDIVVGKLE